MTDAATGKGLRHLGWAIIVLFIIDFALTGGVLVYLSRHIDALSRDQASSCAFFGHLGTALIAAGTAKPSELGIQIVVDSRASYRGHGCAPPLPPPGASFVRWARYYHLPAG